MAHSLKKEKSLATTYFPTSSRGSIIGVRGLNFRVRNGNGCNTSTMVTKQLKLNKRERYVKRNNNMVKPHGRLVLVG